MSYRALFCRKKRTKNPLKKGRAYRYKQRWWQEMSLEKAVKTR